MSRFVQGADRQQQTLLPECLDDYVAEDNPVRVVDDLSVAERLWRRPDHTGLQIQVSIEAPELLELAPGLGPSNAVYRPTH